MEDDDSKDKTTQQPLTHTSSVFAIPDEDGCALGCVLVEKNISLAGCL